MSFNLAALMGQLFIGAINGAAVGIGATMTLPMDVRLAADGARIGFVFGRLGIVPEACSSWFLPRLVGIPQALEWVYSAEPFDAAEGVRAGLLKAAVPGEQLLAEAHKLAHRFIDNRSPVAVALAKHPLVDSHDLSSLNVVMSGAAPLDADLGHAVAQRLGCKVVQGYGMSELSPVSHITPFDGGALDMHTEAPLSSVGWTVSNAVSKLVDPETGDEIDPPSKGLSATGELWFKGPNVMAGYLNNEDATRETIDDDGWLHTGDLAQVDAAGRVYIVDRLKELIKYKG